MDQMRADLISRHYGQGEIHQAGRKLPYYANLLPTLIIHETRPRQTRPDSLYITNGLSAPQDDAPLGFGFELQMIAPGRQAWPVTLLISLAAHTLRTNTEFRIGQSVALADTLTGISDTLSAIVFTRAPALPSVLSFPEGDVRLITVVGITAEEYSWARRYSAHDLIAMLQLCGQGVATLPGRRSVVPAQNMADHRRLA